MQYTHLMLLLWACMLAHDGQPHGHGQREADREGGTPIGERACPPLCNIAAVACACLAAFSSKHHLRLWQAVKLTHDCFKYEGKVWRDHRVPAFLDDRCVASRFRTIIQHAAASGADAAAPRSGTDSTSEIVFPAPMDRHMVPWCHDHWLCFLCHAGPLPAAEHCTIQAGGQQGNQVGCAVGGVEGDATASSGALKQTMKSQGRDLVQAPWRNRHAPSHLTCSSCISLSNLLWVASR